MYVSQLHAGHWYIGQFTNSTLPRLPADLDRAYDTRAQAMAALAEYHRRHTIKGA